MDKKFDELLFSVVDLETTGYIPERNSIIEIGIQQVKNLKLADDFQELICPEKPIPLSITELTGITNDMVVGHPYLDEIESKIVDFLNNTVIVEHSRRDFDLRFLKHSFTTLKEVYHLNTLSLFSELFPTSKKNSLTAAASYFGIKFDDPDLHHHALVDAKICSEILLKLIEELSSRSITCLNDIKTIFGIETFK